MNFCIVIHSAPESSQGSRSALLFAQAVLRGGHRIHRLFFYADGVHNATELRVTPQDEIDLPAGWQRLIRDHELDAVVCIAAGLKRGILDAREARRYDKPAGNLLEDFELSGLGQLLDAAVHCDRVITFGD